MSDLTPSERLVAVNERVSRRAELKEAYQRIYNNPFRYKHSIFDPAVFRYEAARAYSKDFYKYTPRSMLIPLGLLASVVWLQTKLNEQRREKESKIRSGELTYYERAKYASRGLY